MSFVSVLASTHRPFGGYLDCIRTPSNLDILASRGVDSFAFDIQNPRPYDVVMPLDKVLPLPKSVSCDDKLLFRAGADASEQLHKNVESAKSRDTTNVKSELAVCSNDQRVHRSSNSTASTHNERARQRMERVKLATMKREQARLEEQNKREIARITRKLAAEQAASKEAMVSSRLTYSAGAEY